MTDTTPIPAPEVVTPEQVAAILKDVTPAPWSIPGQPDKICAEGYTKNGAAKVIATIHTPAWMGDLEPWANACFVAWARNNIEALAADLAAQKARADAAERRFANAERMLTQAETTLTAERDKVARLVEALRINSAILDAERSRMGGEPFTGKLSFADIEGRYTVSEAIELSRAIIAEVQG